MTSPRYALHGHDRVALDARFRAGSSPVGSLLPLLPFLLSACSLPTCAKSGRCRSVQTQSRRQLMDASWSRLVSRLASRLQLSFLPRLLGASQGASRFSAFLPLLVHAACASTLQIALDTSARMSNMSPTKYCPWPAGFQTWSNITPGIGADVSRPS